MENRTPCPCGVGADLASCCGRYLGGAPAPTAVELMRSRYSAYVIGAIDYVAATHDPATRAQLDVGAADRWARATTWQSLEIVDTVAGGIDDATGEVEFIARGATSGAAFAQRERSRFRRVEGRWHYVDGAITRAPVTVATATARNAPCPCGSGQKYKRCHGA